MKTKSLLLLMVMMLMGAVGVQAKKTAKAVLSNDGTKLTFYYDEVDYSPLKEYSLNLGENDPLWLENKETITEVVFDPSFSGARPTSCYRWFKDMENLTNIVMANPAIDNPTNLNYFVLNTSGVTTMRDMFRGCKKLKELPDLYLLNTSNVTDMTAMFNACYSLEKLDLSDHSYKSNTEGKIRVVSRFKTSNVTSMSTMFYGCTSLTSLNVTTFNTAKVTSMYGMFCLCSKITTLRLGNFNTSSVVDMSFMFNQCYKLQTIIGLDQFDTSQVTNMKQMFCECNNLREVDVSHFNTSKVEIMSFMFYGCYNLFSLDISNFILPVEFTYGMFSQASINFFAIPSCAEVLQENACEGMGSKENPWELICPIGFNPLPKETGEGWMKWKSGYFVVVHKGDANDDGQVTVSDVMLAVNKSLGKPVSIFNMKNADMNNDGAITVADIMQIVQIALNN